MVHDRLKEFRDKAGLDSEVVTITVDGGEEQKQLLDLLDKIGPLYTKLKDMKETVMELRSLIHEHDNRAKLEDGFANLKTDARKIRAQLEEIKQKGAKSSGVVQHAASTHHFSLIHHLTLVFQELSVTQAETQERHRQYVRKELIITGQCGINESELDSLLDQSTEIFTQNIIQETQIARQQLHDLQERHEAVIKLEKSITELWQLFQDIAMHVQQQGESINRIENYIFVAQEKATGAKEQLGQALINKNKAMKKKFICAIIAGVALLIVVLVIIFSFL